MSDESTDQIVSLQEFWAAADIEKLFASLSRLDTAPAAGVRVLTDPIPEASLP